MLLVPCRAYENCFAEAIAIWVVIQEITNYKSWSLSYSAVWNKCPESRTAGQNPENVFFLYKPCFNAGPCSMNFQVLQSQFLSLTVLKSSIWNILQKNKNKDQIFLYIQCDWSPFVPMDVKRQKDWIKFSW